MQNSTPIGDELLSAWLDDELAPAERERVAAAIAAQPALAARLEQLRLANELTRRHAGAIDARPLPAALLHLLENAEQPAALPHNVTVLHGHKWQARPVAVAMAAVLVLAVGIAFNGLQRDATPGVPDLQAALLEQVPSGSSIAAGELQLTPRFSFRNSEGNWCRLYHVAGAVGSTDNIACRMGAGWELQASLAAVTADDSEYRPATGAGSELDTVLDTLMRGAPLSAAEERAVLQQGWDVSR